MSFWQLFKVQPLDVLETCLSTSFYTSRIFLTFQQIIWVHARPVIWPLFLTNMNMVRLLENDCHLSLFNSRDQAYSHREEGKFGGMFSPGPCSYTSS